MWFTIGLIVGLVVGAALGAIGVIMWACCACEDAVSDGML